MQHQPEGGWGDEDARRNLGRWNISNGTLPRVRGVGVASQPAAGQSLLTNPQLVTCAAPVVSSWFGLGNGLESLLRFRNLRTLELPSAYQQNLLPVLNRLRYFPLLEDLELKSIDITRPRWPEMFAMNEVAAEPFCDFSKLKRLVLSDVKVDQLFFAWLAQATNLEILELNDMSYESGLDSLRNLISLRRLKITGSFERIASVFRFVSHFPQLTALTVEMAAPDEEHVRMLTNCPADVHLKVRRCYHPGQIGAICKIRNLKSLTLSSPFGFKIPRGFKALRRLTSLHFIDEENAFNAIEGFENVPTSVNSLTLELRFPNKCRLSRVLHGLATQLTSLSLRQRDVDGGLGLDRLYRLVSLELRGDEDFDVDILEEIAGMTNLNHLAIGGCYNMEHGLSCLVHNLDLHSLSIENGMITPKVMDMLSQLARLSELAFGSCFFRSSNVDDSFASLSTLTSLTIDYPTARPNVDDQLITGLLSHPYFTSLDLFQLRTSSGCLVTEDSRCNDAVVTRSRCCSEI